MNTAQLAKSILDDKRWSKREPGVSFTRLFLSSISVLPPPAFSPFGKFYQGQAQEQHEESPHHGEARARLMLALVQPLRLLLDQLAAYDKEIARLFQERADQPSFSGLPRAGKRLAPPLLAEWDDDRSRYASAASVQAKGGHLAGPLWKRQAGLGTSLGRLVSNLCAMRFSNLLGLRTFQEPWAEAYHQRKRQEGKTHSMAVRSAPPCCGSGSSTLVFRKHEPYQAAIFLAAQQAHGRLVA